MSSAISISKETTLSLYRRMQVIRQTEEQLARSHQRGLVHGACHTYVGEEAIASAVCEHLRPDDVVFSTHRGHGHCIAKGVDVHGMMAEIYGKKSGVCHGKGGSMHIADFSIGMLGANGIVGGGLSIVTGAGLAAQIAGDGGVAVCFFGDGASNAGSFHESLNIAASWKLPMLYVCEHNSWAANTSAQKTHAEDDVAGRAAGYGMPGVVVDGNDVLAVYEAATEAVARARAGEGPTLLECKTYRHRAHTERAGAVDPRPVEEIAAWMERDPIPLLVDHLKQQQGQFSGEEFQAMDDEIMAAIEASVAFAEASPFPAPEAALDDVFAE